MSEVSDGREELPLVRGQGWWLRGATPCPRSVVAERRHPVSEVWATGWSYPASEVRGGQEETPRI